MEIGIGLVFLAGIISFLSPCVFSLVPIYLGILGKNIGESDNIRFQKTRLIFAGFAFFLGFSLIFITLGIATTAIGAIFYSVKSWIARIGGVIIIFLGLQMTGLFNFPFLENSWIPVRNKSTGKPFIDNFLFGIAFSAGWSPCIGPILGSILTALISSKISPLYGGLFLFSYSLGLAIPFLIVAIGIQPIMNHFKQKPFLLKRIQQVSGWVFVLFGVLLTFGVLNLLANIAPKWII